MKTLLTFLVCLLIIAAFGYGIYRSITLGSSDDDYEIICIHGHQYYRANWLNKGFLSIRLDDAGKPVRCQS